MEENKKNEFDDIILQKSNKNEKIKKLLLRAIILVIVFLVVMIVMKLINNPSEENSLQVPAEPQNQASYGDNFSSLPIIDSSKEEDEFEALARKLKEESMTSDVNTSSNDIVEENTSNVVANNSVLDQINAVEPKEEVVIEEKKPEVVAEKIPEKTVKKPIEKTNSNIKEKAPQTNNATPNTNELFENIKTSDSALQAGAYIQVFSLNTLDPKSKELKILKDNGYEYKIYKTNVNGKELTKVLVGPYKESELKTELEKIRSKIAKGAFTFRVK
ncbi:SPOR domain-containing protein [Campylobacter volucris]|uniref:SPOR domain-containing protein n=1 Tax=Campylobacter volucris TaxID=1031542 RepID=UPI00189EFDED|nr:SPOR domain-containing protein [Campylobacter volucris]MBF7048850.1 SPOR domain-containing protein [Campylobacter volucris]MBF7060892.1 SPOR domain-containing protein [Campylobacter volucris]